MCYLKPHCTANQVFRVGEDPLDDLRGGRECRGGNACDTLQPLDDSQKLVVCLLRPQGILRAGEYLDKMPRMILACTSGGEVRRISWNRARVGPLICSGSMSRLQNRGRTLCVCGS
jgi:hypothetical protein